MIDVNEQALALKRLKARSDSPAYIATRAVKLEHFYVQLQKHFLSNIHTE